MILTYTLTGFLAGVILPELLVLINNPSLRICWQFKMTCGIVGAVIAYGLVS
jgi:hypothetical protein